METNDNLEELADSLRAGKVRFCYVKKNGRLRDAVGTLNPLLIPAAKMPKGTGREPSKTVLVYYDLRRRAWRCLRRERFVGIIEDVD
jgi:hypothetical protein